MSARNWIITFNQSGIVLCSPDCGSQGSKGPSGSMIIAIKCLSSTEHTLGSGRADLLMNFILNSCWMNSLLPQLLQFRKLCSSPGTGSGLSHWCETVPLLAWPARDTANHYRGLSPPQRKISAVFARGRCKQLTARLSRGAFSNAASLF